MSNPILWTASAQLTVRWQSLNIAMDLFQRIDVAVDRGRLDVDEKTGLLELIEQTATGPILRFEQLPARAQRILVAAER